MTANICLKYPLCVEWTTELPFKDTPRKSPIISLEGSEWFLELTYNSPNDIYLVQLLKIISIKSSNFNQPRVAIISVRDAGSLCKPMLSGQCYTGIWSRTKKEVFDEIPQIFTTGKIKVLCVFYVYETPSEKIHIATQTDGASPFSTAVSIGLQSLSRDFSVFLKDEKFSDVRLKCADRIFSAHSSVLAACSGVFAAMFRDKMAQKEADLVNIKDVDPEMLDTLLKYMYSGEKPDLCEDTARRIYEAADKYAVRGLKEACSDWMVGNQTEETCLELLVLADEHEDADLKDAVMCFVAEHLASLSVESWSGFKDKYPQLVIPVFEKRFADSLPGVAKTPGK